MEEQTRYELFIASALDDRTKYREQLSGDGSFEFSRQVADLQQLSNKMSQSTLVYLFGQQLGEHLFDKFVNQCSRNLLLFLNMITAEFRFFILYELKTNKELFFH